ncbi:5'-nucleotidase [Cutibacterium acnes JCM 18918]|nr:5'-nucleotidase [Cutibacterium acnes JCM 18918]
MPHLNSPYLGANVYEKGTTKVAAPLKASTIIVKDGVRIGVVGAVTHDLPPWSPPPAFPTSPLVIRLRL